ncbi:hypothetical protein U1Q18_003539, partial [Sarracenia purpurea var. burkii]
LSSGFAYFQTIDPRSGSSLVSRPLVRTSDPGSGSSWALSQGRFGALVVPTELTDLVGSPGR